MHAQNATRAKRPVGSRAAVTHSWLRTCIMWLFLGPYCTRTLSQIWVNEISARGGGLSGVNREIGYPLNENLEYLGKYIN